ncbi:hypothetical protein [Planococcus lenghuensis]|uniref:Uncharacterized protein n=1 Tax=Planococcus lenghuensis TaxID=2213202 RepID=A0A1Q2KZ58_9BACL|nr:hypothetical protein [Planococcus lenghuensis]AQQ53488.1 hypothetical protein B0X71_10660 [Planococcus lenghuensis]
MQKIKWRLLFIICCLTVLPVFFVGGTFHYEMALKETLLVESASPNNINHIEVVQKGSSFFFGPSSVQIEYGWMKQVDNSISNDGKTLDASNASVSWKSDHEATIMLYGEEQAPEAVDIKFPGSEKDEVETSVSSGLYTDTGQAPGSLLFKMNYSPKQVNTVEFREVAGDGVRIYIGEKGTALTHYARYQLVGMYTPDNFQISWKDDRNATVEVVRTDDTGTTFIEETIHLTVPSS